MAKWIGGSSSKRAHQRAGDAARDRRDWPAAAEAYRRHLVEQPDDGPLWVQLGHSLKEHGALDEAVAAYDHARLLRPDDADAMLHQAHLHKRMGHVEQASILFTRLLRLTGQREMFHQLVALGTASELGDDGKPVGTTIQGDAVMIEVDDLLGFLEVHKTVSGIQRVQLGVMDYVLNQRTPGLTCAFVLNESGSPCLWRLAEADLRPIVSALDAPQVDILALRRQVREARRNAVALTARAGQCYLVLGAFWFYSRSISRYYDLKRAGVAIGAYIYDLIPITHTEYCDEGLPYEFTLSLGDVLNTFDFLLAISEYTATELRRYVDKVGLPPRPIEAVTLAHQNTATRAAAPTWGRSFEFLRDRPFAMMVSTIEARKNHAYLVAAWKHFVDEGLDPPDLVFVGRQGWRVTSLMEMLEASRFLDHRIHILHDLSDAELNTLYDASLFTLFPSFVEGWGLPVGESLARGKPCVASSVSSIPEVGGDLVDYVDPLNLRDGIEVIRRMAFDTDYRTARAAEIRRRFKVRTWADVGAELLATTQRLARSVSVNRTPEALLPPGLPFFPGSLALGRRIPDTYAAHPIRAVMEMGWYALEDLGCWMQNRRGQLLFRTGLAPGTAIIAYAAFYASTDVHPSLRLNVAIADPAQPTPDLPPDGHRVPQGQHFSLRVTGHVGADGLVRVIIRLRGPVRLEDDDPAGRRYAVGLGGFAYAPADDAATQLRAAEALLLGPPPEPGPPGLPDEEEELQNSSAA